MGKAVNGGLEEEVKPYSNFISRMSCLPQLRLIIQLHTNPSHSPKISLFVSGREKKVPELVKIANWKKLKKKLCLDSIFVSFLSVTHPPPI